MADLRIRVPKVSDPALQRAFSDFARQVERALADLRPGPQISRDEPVSEGTLGKVTMKDTAETVLASVTLASRRPATLSATGSVEVTALRQIVFRIREGSAGGAIVRTVTQEAAANTKTPFSLTKELAAPKQLYVLTAQNGATGGTPTAHSVLLEAVSR